MTVCEAIFYAPIRLVVQSLVQISGQVINQACTISISHDVVDSLYSVTAELKYY
jgi:type 1 fimbria pilin